MSVSQEKIFQPVSDVSACLAANATSNPVESLNHSIGLGARAFIASFMSCYGRRFTLPPISAPAKYKDLRRSYNSLVDMVIWQNNDTRPMVVERVYEELAISISAEVPVSVFVVRSSIAHCRPPQVIHSMVKAEERRVKSNVAKTTTKAKARRRALKLHKEVRFVSHWYATIIGRSLSRSITIRDDVIHPRPKHTARTARRRGRC